MKLRWTPCIGICSTTYGDLVCRGCKRFAHEIADWNRYEGVQHDVIRARLTELKEASAAQYVTISDDEKLRAAARALRIRQADELGTLSIAYEILRRASGAPDLAELGLERASGGAGLSIEDLFRAIDREFYLRSTATYEHSFRVAPQ